MLESDQPVCFVHGRCLILALLHQGHVRDLDALARDK
jgi:hypothetical protein